MLFVYESVVMKEKSDEDRARELLRYMQGEELD